MLTWFAETFESGTQFVSLLRRYAEDLAVLLGKPVTHPRARFAPVQVGEVVAKPVHFGEEPFGFERVPVLVCGGHGKIVPRPLAPRKRVVELVPEFAARRLPLGIRGCGSGTCSRRFPAEGIPHREILQASAPEYSEHLASLFSWGVPG
jgi:hypothetical protein